MKYLFLFSVLITVDAAIKWFAQKFLSNAIVLIPQILSLEYYENTGIAFSFPLTGIALKVITVFLIFGFFWYYWKYERPKQSTLLNMSYTAILSGAMGNGWERILQGYVVDFISVEGFFVCNFADIYISLGAIGLVIYYLRDTSTF